MHIDYNMLYIEYVCTISPYIGRYRNGTFGPNVHFEHLHICIYIYRTDSTPCIFCSRTTLPANNQLYSRRPSTSTLCTFYPPHILFVLVTGVVGMLVDSRGYACMHTLCLLYIKFGFLALAIFMLFQLRQTIISLYELNMLNIIYTYII